MSSRIAVIGTGLRRPHHRRLLRPPRATRSCAPTSMPEKVERLKRGEVPILEAGLDELVREGLAVGRLSLRARRRADAVSDCEFVFLCVPTPQGADGSADLSYIEAAAARDRPGPASPRRSSSTSRPCRSARPGSSSRRSAAPTCSSCRTPSSSARARPSTTSSTPTASSSAPTTRPPPSGWPALYLGLAAPLIVTDPASAETIKYASQRVPRHQDLLRQRHRRGVRGGRRRRQRRRARHGLRQAHRPRVPPARPGLGRLAASRRTRGRWCASPRTRATTSTCSRASSPSTRSSSTGWPTRSSDLAGGSLDGVTRRGVGPHVQGPHRRPPRLARRSRSSAGCASGAPWSGPTTRRSSGDAARRSTASRSCADPYAACEGADGARRAHRVGRVPLARLRQGGRDHGAAGGSSTPATCSTATRSRRRGFEYRGHRAG